MKAMGDLGEFEERVRVRVLEAQRRRAAHEEQLQRRAQELLQRSHQFRDTADHLLQSVIRPRLEKVTTFLGNGSMLSADAVSRYQCVCRFAPAGRFSSTTRLSLGLSHDVHFEHLILLYDLEILPIPFPFQASDQQQCHRLAIDEERVIRWADDNLLRFVDTYLCLKDGDLPNLDSNGDRMRFAA